MRRFGSTPTLWVRDLGVLEQSHVDDPALDCRHCLQLDDLAGLDDALGGPVRDVAELLLAPSAVVLDVDRDAVVLALASADDEVDDVLEARELLAAPADQRPEIVAPNIKTPVSPPRAISTVAPQAHQPGSSPRARPWPCRASGAPRR